MEIETSVLNSAAMPLERYATVMNRSFKDSALRAGRGVAKYAIRITPPFSADGGPDAASGPAFNRGKSTISRDLRRHFRPVRIKGVGPGAQDPVAIYLRLIRGGRKRFGRPLQRDQAAPYFVDAGRFSRLEAMLYRKVGKTASGWVAAASRLNATGTPGWVSRHGTSRGSVEIDLDGSEISISMSNNVGEYVPAGEMQRRANAALVYQAKAMNREVEFMLNKTAVECGLGTAA